MKTPGSGYQVKYENYQLGRTQFEIRSLLDRQQFHDPLGTAAAAGISSASWPLFGMVWPSARMLANTMQTQEIVDKRILEVGCGLGLASLVLQRRLGDITASDRHPLTQLFLNENARINSLPMVKYQTGQWDRINPALGRFDLIIASDVLYERSHPEMLAGFLDQHAQEDATIIVVDPDRGNRNAFTRAMQHLGYSADLQKAGATQITGETYKGHLLTLRR
jgi:2-polyprenyl-3-methyl-5-hydroxy-6-metoxy-1,4-benzoquinol methylase